MTRLIDETDEDKERRWFIPSISGNTVREGDFVYLHYCYEYELKAIGDEEQIVGEGYSPVAFGNYSTEYVAEFRS